MSNFYDTLGMGMALGNRKLVDQANSAIHGMEAIKNALVQALAEVAPDHPLLDKSVREKIYKDNYRP